MDAGEILLVLVAVAVGFFAKGVTCLLYTSDAADDSVYV